MPKRNLILLSGLLGLGCLFTACNRKEIERYRVEKEPEGLREGRSASAADSEGEGPQRLLAAIRREGDDVWFFKMAGAPDRVAKHADGFRQFLNSVQFTGDSSDPIEWTPPEGWREEAGTGMRAATLQAGPKDDPIELTVVPLGAEAGEILPNVNRWRRQIGLPPISAGELDTVTETIEIAGDDAIQVDMEGPGGSGESQAPFASRLSDPGPSGSVPERATQEGDREGAGADREAGGAGEVDGADAGDDNFSYTVPSGWEPNPGASRMRRASFQVQEGDEAADVSVIALPGEAGGLVRNVNRWRGQVGLAPMDETEIREQARSLEVAGREGVYFDLQGEGDDRILAVVVEHAGESWFFKMTGPAALVGEEKAAFETFVRSVNFEENQ